MKKTGERQGLQRLGRLVSKITDPALRKRGFIHTEIISRWETIVGDELSSASIPQRISFPARQSSEPGVLHVRVEGARAIELQHMAPLVIERINTYFGYRAINALKLTQDEFRETPDNAAVPPEPVTETREAGTDDRIANTRDPALREALTALGRRLQGTRPGPSPED